VFFYHSSYGGCCDCGDHYAWDPRGFCPHHGSKIESPDKYIPLDLRDRAKSMFAFLAQNIAAFSSYNYVTLDQQCNYVQPPWISNDSFQLRQTENKFLVSVFFDERHSKADFVQAMSSPDIEALVGRVLSINDREWDIGRMVVCSGVSLPLAEKIADVFHNNKSFTTNILHEEDKMRLDGVVSSLAWLTAVAEINDGFKRLVCRSFSMSDLVLLMQQDLRSERTMSRSLHNLFLTLMGDPSFKTWCAVAYVHAYGAASKQYSLGYGQNGKSIFHISVQFLNRDHWVYEACYNHGFLNIVTAALHDMLVVPFITSSTHLVGSSSLPLKHFVFAQRRYIPVIGDLKVCV
jgi:hypothetical protein